MGEARDDGDGGGGIRMTKGREARGVDSGDLGGDDIGGTAGGGQQRWGRRKMRAMEGREESDNSGGGAGAMTLDQLGISDVGK